MSHFDTRAFQEREELVDRMAEGRAAFVKGLQEAAAAHQSTASTGARDKPDLMHQSADSKTHRSIFDPLHYFFQLACEGQKAFRKVLGRKKGSP